MPMDTKCLHPLHDAMPNAKSVEAMRQARKREEIVEYSNLDELKNSLREP